MKTSNTVLDPNPCCFIIDMDRTLCEPNKVTGPNRTDAYNHVEPIWPTVRKVRELKARGHTIIIHSARNMKTFDGNPKLLDAVTLPIMIAWLQKHDIPYDAVILGKPWSDLPTFIVDDRNISVSQFLVGEDIDDWSDNITENMIGLF